MARRFARVSALAASAAMLLAACGSTGGSSNTTSTRSAATGGAVTFALQPGTTPNYILPLFASQYFTAANTSQFQFLMYRPLYWFGDNGKPVNNPSLSLAEPPVFSNNNTVVTVTLKKYMWSNNTPVTTRNILFWQNLVTANKNIWAAYVPGGYPDDIKSTTVVNGRTIRFTLTRSFNPHWFLYNELSQITPLPMTWDRESAHGSVGNFDETTSGAKKVYSFLEQQASDLATYATNPLWQTVDGPWRLKSFTSTGYVAMVPNKLYSGLIKPKISEFIEQPYASESAEMNVLLAGHTIDYGYVAENDIPILSRVRAAGYYLASWKGWGVNYFPYNFNNPTVGPIFRQLYFRQAFQSLINQPADVKGPYHGYASPTYGPVPIQPANPYVSTFERSNPYPFSTARAKALLVAHGWSMGPSGYRVCVRPGTSSGDCGPGVVQGARLQFNLEYASGYPSLETTLVELASSAATVGIKIDLVARTANDVVSAAIPCSPSQASCNWQLADWGGLGWVFSPDYEPSGGELFQTGAASDYGSYSSGINDSNIALTHTALPSQESSSFARYENYLAKQLPVVWQVEPFYQVSAISKSLSGVLPQDPILNIYPEEWSLK